MEITKELQKFNVTDAAIQELSTRYMPLVVDGIADKKGFDAVHEARMDIVKRRTAVEKTRKELKADSLEYGRRVDAEAKRITGMLVPIEEHLQSQEDIINNEKARIKAEAEAKEAARIQKRVDLICSYGPNFNGTEYIVYGLMIPVAIVKTATDEDFDSFIDKVQYAKILEEDRIAAIEAARQEEENRLAKIAAEQEAERLRLEAIQKEQEAAAEKIQADKDAIEKEKQRLIDEEALRLKKIEDDKKAAEAEKKRLEELDRVAEEAAEKARIEEQEKIAQRIKERAEAELREKEELERQEALKPDKEKMLTLAYALETMIMPQVGEGCHQLVKDVQIHLTKTAAYIRKAVKEL